jgi:hypothetical protein
VLLSAHTSDQRAEVTSLRAEAASLAGTPPPGGPGQPTRRESRKSLSKESSVKSLPKELVTGSVAREGRRDEAAVQGSTAPRYQPEDQAAAERLAKLSAPGTVVREVPRLMVEGRRHRLDSQGDSRQGGLLAPHKSSL